MKKIVQIVAATIVSAACMGSFASADSCAGQIGDTGPASNNTISCTDVNHVTVTCNNNVWVGNVNDQTAASGSGSVMYNTSTGGVLTGQAVNTNGQNVTIGATGCAPVAAPVAAGGGAVSAASAPGAGAVAPQQSPAPGKGAFAPAALPYTAGNSAAAVVITSLGAAAGVLGASRLAVSAYRRYGLK